MLEVRDLSKSFGTRFVLTNASLSLAAGGGLRLAGPNGAGKSTLLKTIVGLLTPDRGEVLLDGKPAATRKLVMSYCASTGGFYRRLTGRQNLHYFGALYGLARRQVDGFISDQRIFEIDFWDTPVERLSTGMLQKINLARAFAHDPRLVLLDEPLNSLDDGSRGPFLAHLDAWARLAPGRAYVLAQHDLAARLPTLRLEGGRLEGGA